MVSTQFANFFLASNGNNNNNNSNSNNSNSNSQFQWSNKQRGKILQNVIFLFCKSKTQTSNLQRKSKFELLQTKKLFLTKFICRCINNSKILIYYNLKESNAPPKFLEQMLSFIWLKFFHNRHGESLALHFIFFGSLKFFLFEDP